MNNSQSLPSGIPSTGKVLDFIVDCLGVPKANELFHTKELQRLSKGGLSHEKYWAVAHKVICGIVASFNDWNAARQMVDRAISQRHNAPIKNVSKRLFKDTWVFVPDLMPPSDAVRWKVNAAGEVENLPERLVLDWVEFLERNEFLFQRIASQPQSPEQFFYWISLFVIPFLAYNLIEYLEVHAAFESGMPAGSFWYLPEVENGKDGKSYTVSEWPINKVLAWWEDLLGEKFYSNPGLLFPKGCEGDDIKRQVYRWRYEKEPPKQDAILRWCRQNWNGKYKGTFKNDPSLPLQEQWQLCRAFLVNKGLHHSTTNWVEELPEQIRASFKANNYRGEPLELQILRFEDFSFADFFDSPDPIAEGLPVTELIARVAVRYAKPTNQQLKARLLMAAAFQRAFLNFEPYPETDVAARICAMYKEIYHYLIQMQNAGSTRESRLDHLRSTPNNELKLRYACEWLFDEKCWEELPSLLAGNTSLR